jgi:hypothetical protein
MYFFGTNFATTENFAKNQPFGFIDLEEYKFLKLAGIFNLKLVIWFLEVIHVP